MTLECDRDDAHRRFLSLIQDFYRAAGQDPGRFDSSADAPIAFEVRMNDAVVSVGYDAHATVPGLFLHCAFGRAPVEFECAVLRELLARNLSQARRDGASYCMDRATGDITYFLRRDLVTATATQLRDDLADLARQVAHWRRDCFLGSPSAEETNSGSDLAQTALSIYA